MGPRSVRDKDVPLYIICTSLFLEDKDNILVIRIRIQLTALYDQVLSVIFTACSFSAVGAASVTFTSQVFSEYSTTSSSNPMCML